MSAIDINQFAGQMVTAAQGALSKQWPTVKDYAKGEFEKLARTFTQIETLSITKQISPGEASVLFEMQKNTARSVMLALEGMSLLLVEGAINAALSAVKTAVNKALGFTLI